MKKQQDANWIWMPHAGHFFLWRKCEFRLNTYVNGYIVLTVGEYRGSINKEHNVGHGYKYGTMIFKAKKSIYKCCPYMQKDGNDADFAGYDTADAAYKGHMDMCRKYSNKGVKP